MKQNAVWYFIKK